MGMLDAITDNASVNVLPYDARRGMAVTESVKGTYLFDRNSLATLEQVRKK
jgi:hypothetical protein